MSLREKFTETLKDAMKAKDTVRLETVRMAIAEMKKRDIEARTTGNMDGIGDGEIQSMLQKMVASRRDSIALYEKGGRPELAAKEQAEIAVIESFLPKQMSADEVEAAAKAEIAAAGAASIRDMGKVMGAMKAKYTGQMDMAAASAAVKKLLGG
ncbi:MAG: GatB/YqeY domain-containing protein [Alphaproteobacteria bacterium]|nr:GatB/YqeY domain-containing protein [Alphaproteobacteria bacterium]